VLDAVDYGLMLLTGGGALVWANRIARRECGVPGRLRVVGGCVAGADEATCRHLREAIAGACVGRRSLVPMPARADAPPWSIAVLPLGGAGGRGEESGVLLMLGRSQVCQPLSVDFFARVHKVTTAEKTVLLALCQGLSAGEQARALGVAVCTVRTHISSLRMKTGARNIGDLVRMVTALPPIVPALN
jgi:DNA-binding CsgD family transcriptional regulator